MESHSTQSIFCTVSTFFFYTTALHLNSIYVHQGLMIRFSTFYTDSEEEAGGEMNCKRGEDGRAEELNTKQLSQYRVEVTLRE